MPLLTHNCLNTVSHTLAIPRLAAGFEGFRVAHLSDLHFYQYTDPSFYERVVQTVNGLDVDLVALTGDVIHYGDKYIDLAAEYLSRLTARHGKVAAIGNHDFFDNAGSERIAAMLRRAGFTVLRNQSDCLVMPGNDRLWLAGLDDLKYGAPDINRALRDVPTREEATMVLAHNPLLFDPLAYREEGPVDLVLSGHTHGGHVYIPPLEAIYKNVFRMKYRYGLYRKGQSQLYLTCGLGSAAFYCFKPKLQFGFPRFRHNTVPEIAVLTLTASQS